MVIGKTGWIERGRLEHKAHDYDCESGNYDRFHKDGWVFYSGKDIKSLVEFASKLRTKKSYFVLDLYKIGKSIIKWLSDNGYIWLQDFEGDKDFLGREYAKIRLDAMKPLYMSKPDWYKKQHSYKWFVIHNWTRPVFDKEYSFIDRNGSILELHIGDKLVLKDAKALNYSIGKEVQGETLLDKEVSFDNEMRTFVKSLHDMNVKIKLTSGATAYENWKEKLWHKISDLNFNDKVVAKKQGGFVIKGYEWKDGRAISSSRYKKLMQRKIDSLLPKDTNTINKLNMLEPAVRGGISKANERFIGQVVFGKHLDINSSFMSVMDSDLLYPVGKPLDKKPEGKSVSMITFKMINEVHNNGGLPFVPVKHDKGATEYLNDVPKGYTNMFFSPEFELFKEQYNVKDNDYKIVKQVWFETRTGKELAFGDYSDEWYPMKQQARKEGNEPKAKSAKMFVVSLYGYFLKNADFFDFYRKDLKTGLLDEKGEAFPVVKHVERTYKPIGIAIASYARIKLIKACADLWDLHIYYTDTDSIFCDMEAWKVLKDRLDIDETELGAWKEEPDDLGEYMFGGSKQYTTLALGKWKSTISGVQWTDEKPYATFDDMKNGFTIGNQEHWVDGQLNITEYHYEGVH